MTLIIGIRCVDGIVLGADTRTTYGVMGQPTIHQEEPFKLQILCDKKAILGVSGPVGLAQRFAGEIERMYSGKKLQGAPDQVMTAIRIALWEKHLGMEMQVANVAKQVIGGVASQSVLCSTILAFPVAGTPCLFQFDQQGAPEQAKDNIVFYAIGSAQARADPFLAFLRRTFWNQRVPSLLDGIFACVWTLDYIIKSDPGGVGGVPRIAVLEMKGRDWVARHLDETELEENKQAIAAATAHLASFARGQTDKGAQKRGPPPPPPS
jgi:predicted proteasome-type protease